MLAVPADHPLAQKRHAEPVDLLEETLFTYPVPSERLDVFTQFLVPATSRPCHHRNVEATEMMLQLVAASAPFRTGLCVGKPRHSVFVPSASVKAVFRKASISA